MKDTHGSNSFKYNMGYDPGEGFKDSPFAWCQSSVTERAVPVLRAFQSGENEVTVCSSQGVSIAQLKGTDIDLKEFLKPKYTRFFEKTTGIINFILELLAYIPYNWDERRA